MRITGGQWRGRRLSAVPGSAVRPTTDLARETIFNVLGSSVWEATVADLCCGSGALGIEALSRGAMHVDFVDLAPACLKTVHENLAPFGAEPGRWALHRADAVRWLKRRLAKDGPPLLVLADPPYGGPVAEALASVLWSAPSRRLAAAVLEHAPTLVWPVSESEHTAWKRETRSYGRTTLTLLRPLHASSEEDHHA